MNPEAPPASRLIDGPDNEAATVLLAHGAGAAMDSPFMAAIASGLAESGRRLVRFDFPYMARQRILGFRRGLALCPCCRRRSARRCDWRRRSSQADWCSLVARRWAAGYPACWSMSWPPAEQPVDPKSVPLLEVESAANVGELSRSAERAAGSMEQVSGGVAGVSPRGWRASRSALRRTSLGPVARYLVGRSMCRPVLRRCRLLRRRRARRAKTRSSWGSRTRTPTGTRPSRGR